MKNLKVLTCFFLGAVIIGCGGREANPVDCMTYHDREMSCASILDEKREVEDKISKLKPRSSKTGKNVACVAGSLLFLPALCFMDLKNAEKTELEAYQRRYRHLDRLYRDKGCDGKKCNVKK